MDKFRAFLATTAAATLVLGVAACDRPTDADRRSSAAPATGRAPASPASPAVPAPGRTAGQTIDDAGITAKVKSALAAEKDVSATSINVDTVQGKVTLSGKVASDSEAQRATQVARGIEGVRDVENKLSVGS